MSIISLFAIFFVLWWLVLFAVLPFGVKRDEKPELGNDPGAPVNPMLMKKFLWTTAITAMLTGGLFLVDQAGLLSVTAWFDIPENWYER